ncbi:hypothetical protein M2175_001406 [Bradyrhizobium elkanii]|nr:MULTISPECIES: hypothetical protein [Bradyrhizobium]MCS3926375.1 hypothetical protein [Bradyrhizobium elkanii]MCS3966926.1 hypothetical protein [Bradyrhizobium japonicum]
MSSFATILTLLGPGHWLLGAINRCDQRKNFEEAEAKAIVVE